MENARIRIVHESEATGETAAVYREIEQYFGLSLVPDIFKLAGARPDFLRVLWGGYRAMFDGGHLPRDVKEMMATTVSSANSCEYCTQTHSMFVRTLGGSAESCTAAESRDVAALPIDAKYKALLEFGLKITDHADLVTDDDFTALRANGLTEEEITEGVFVAALFNGINRIADAFGLKQLMQLREPAHK